MWIGALLAPFVLFLALELVAVPFLGALQLLFGLFRAAAGATTATSTTVDMWSTSTTATSTTCVIVKSCACFLLLLFLLHVLPEYSGFVPAIWRLPPFDLAIPQQTLTVREHQQQQAKQLRR